MSGENSKKVVLYGKYNEAGDIFTPGFCEDVNPVSVNSSVAEKKLCCNFFSTQFFTDKQQYFFFPFGEFNGNIIDVF